MSSKQWIRVTSGKPGAGHIGYIVRKCKHHGMPLLMIRFALPYPRDLVSKMAGTFEPLDEVAGAVQELLASATASPAPA